MPSDAVDVYNSLKADVLTLIDLHPFAKVPKRGRPPGDTGPLLRAGVLLLVTAWENYIEEMLRQALAAIEDPVKQDNSLLPTTLQKHVQDRAKQDFWLVSGDSWWTIAEDSGLQLIRRLNTPSAGNIESLAHDTLGLSSILSKCRWQKQSAAQVRANLDLLVREIRGEIAHRGTTPGRLTLGGVRSWIDFISRLVDKLDALVAIEMQARYHARPWA